jgi:hypothetical protein
MLDKPGAADRTRGFLADIHAQHAIAPIRYADTQGAFVASVVETLFGDALPIVPDANVLRGNIGRACRDGRGTVLMTGANTGTFRLFCAAHVVEEVREHSERWAFEMGIPYNAYVECWNQSLLPHLRLVDTRGLRELLSPGEGERVDALRDRDDTPSVMLALALGAFYLTEDGPARLAVYGVDLEPDERRKWLERLRCGGDAGELWKLILAATAVPTLAVTGLWNLGRWLYERSPWALAAALGPAVFFAMKAKPESYRRLGAMLHDSAMYFADGVIVPYNESIARFNAMAPPIPSWEELTSTNPRDAVLMRACLHKLARSRKSPMSVRELAAELPTLGIGQGEQRVRQTLRCNKCFFEPYKGKWQIGYAIVRAQQSSTPPPATMSS